MNLYTVKASVRWQTVGKPGLGDWYDEEVTVLADGDARKAVEKAEQHLMKRRDKWEDDNGKAQVNVCKGFRLISVERECGIDVR